MWFNVSKASKWVFHYRNIWNEVEVHQFEKLITEPIKGVMLNICIVSWKCGSYITNLKVDLVYKGKNYPQGKDSYFQVYGKECT